MTPIRKARSRLLAKIGRAIDGLLNLCLGGTRRRSYARALSARHSRGVMRRTLFAPMVGLWPAPTRSARRHWSHKREPVFWRIPGRYV
jgi:hypothetical protein